MEIEARSVDNDNVTMLVGVTEKMLERLPVAVYRSAPDGTLLAANPALADLLGYSSVDELLRDTASVESYYVDTPERELWLDQISEAGEVLDFDIELRRHDGSTIWVQDTARAVFDDDGSLAFCEGALIDMTEKVKARRARDEFVATVSHELRNPMTVLLGLAQELADDYESFTERERREVAQMMAHQADDASWIIEDLLVAYREDLSQLTVVPEAFDVAEEVERVLEGLDVPIAFEPDTSALQVRADPRRTRQILRNLLSNAVRYGGDEIKVVTRRGDTDMLHILVCDNGEPLDPHEAQRIFDSYRRGSGLLNTESVGLGLSVARKLAGLMGGRISYEHDGNYSSFIVTLPSAP